MRRVWTVILLVCLVACAGGGSEDEPAAPTAAAVSAVSGAGTATAPDGLSIAYTVTGDGPIALVFVHGWSGDRSYW